MSEQNLHDLIEETALVLQKLLRALKNEVPESSSFGLDGSEAHSNTSSDANNIDKIGSALASKERKIALILKFPNCISCDEEDDEDARNFMDDDNITEINLDPSIAQPMSPTHQLGSFISGLMSPPALVTNSLEKKMDLFQQKLDDFAQDLSMRLEMLHNRVGTLEHSTDEQIKSVKSHKPKHK